MKLFFSTLLALNFIFPQNVIHEDFVLKIGERLYSPLSDRPYNGKVIKFFTFEQVKYEYFVSDGMKEGLYKSYFEGGNIQEEGYYLDGLKDGAWKKYDQYYDRDRKLAHFISDEYIFENGKLVKLINYSVDGSIKKTKKY